MSIYKTFESYRKEWKQAFSSVPPIPLNIDIELTSICNLNCGFCFVSEETFTRLMAYKGPGGEPKKRIMPREMALNIIDEADEVGVPALKFNWRGEPTLHPNFSEIVDYARRQNSFLDLLVNTNGNCPEQAMTGLLATTKVAISMDSLTLSTYSYMRRGGDMYKAIDTVNRLIMGGHKNIWVRRVISEINKAEDFRADVKKMWGDRVKCSEHYVFNRNIGENHESEENKHTQGMERIYCGYPSQRIIVSCTGNTIPCCVDVYEEMITGYYDRDEYSILKTWHSQGLEDLRKQLRNNVFKSDICRNCTSWQSYNVKQREFVQDK